MALWYFTRGTGVAALVLFTVTVALGVANAKRLTTRNTPRMVIDRVHRNAALLSVTFLVLHIVTTLADGYAPVHVIDAVIPFGAAYHPLFLGLGAIAFDLVLAVMLTSALRRRIGHRAWRAVHWATYASWPVALIHGIGMGSDRHTTWMLALTAACIATVGIAVLVRVTHVPRAPVRRRRHSTRQPASAPPAGTVRVSVSASR
jgi:sulfoxide reductase heme-binding subunit YedZ